MFLNFPLFLGGATQRPHNSINENLHHRCSTSKHVTGVDREPSWPSQRCATVLNGATASVATFVENAWVMQRQIQHLKRFWSAKKG